MIRRISFALALLPWTALAQTPIPPQYVIQEAAREASQQQALAILARAQAEELRAKVADLEKQIAEAAIIARAQAEDLRAKVADLEKQIAEAKKKPDAPAE